MSRISKVFKCARMTRILAICASLALVTGFVAIPSAGAARKHHKDAPGITTKTKTITIGGSTPETGPDAPFAENAEGWQAYVNYVNAHGGVHGWKLKLDVLNDKYTAGLALTDLKRFEAEHIFAYVGAGGTGGNVGVLHYAVQHNILDAGFLTDGGISAKKYPHAKDLFPGIPPYGPMAAFLAEYLIKNDHASKLAIAYQNTSAGLAAEPGFTYEVRKLGAKAVASVPVSNTATDYSGYASSLKSSGATAVLVWGTPPQLIGIMKAAQAIGYAPHWATLFGNESASIMQAIGSTANGIISTSWLPTVTSTTPGIRVMLHWLEKSTPDKSPSILGELGWIGMGVLVHGLKVATKKGRAPTVAGVESALAKGPFHPGHVGVRFSYVGNPRVLTAPNTIVKWNGKLFAKVEGPVAEPSIPRKLLR